jgi:hypothetical protein
MKKQNIAPALILILLGGWFLSIEIIPGIKAFAYGATTWPIPIIGIGALFTLVGLLTWTPGLMIPASIIGCIGGLLFWQNTTGNWESWSYAWSLIIVAVGIGILLTGLMSRDRGALIGAMWVILVGVVNFTVFGAFLGGGTIIHQYWPVAIIIVGVVILLSGLFRKKG